MKTFALVLSGLMLTSTVALAQPKPRTPDESEDDPAIQMDDEDDATDDASDDEAAPPRRHRDDDADDEDGDGDGDRGRGRDDEDDEDEDEPAASAAPPERRPAHYTIGLGLGYVLPAELKMPNVTSARFRLASGVTYEPTLILDHTTTKHDDGTTVANDARNHTEVAVSVRYPFRRNDRVDFSGIALVDLARVSTDPSGDANSRTETTFALGYGIGLDYWINPHWDLSMTATNPFISTTKASQQQGTGVRDSSTSSTTFAAIFDPTLAVMIHLYL